MRLLISENDKLNLELNQLKAEKDLDEKFYEKNN